MEVLLEPFSRSVRRFLFPRMTPSLFVMATAIISNRPGAIVEFTRAGGLDSNPSGDWLSVLTPWPLGLVRRTEHCRPGQLGAPVSRRVQPPVREVSPATF